MTILNIHAPEKKKAARGNNSPQMIKILKKAARGNNSPQMIKILKKAIMHRQKLKNNLNNNPTEEDKMLYKKKGMFI